MAAVFKKMIYEFSVFLFFTMLLDLFGVSGGVNLLITIVLVNIFKKMMPYKKGDDHELDERVESNAQKAGLMTLAFVMILLGIVFFILKYQGNALADIILFIVLGIYLSYLCMLTICMRNH